MVISFKMRNYRSFKDEMIFSMLADASKLKTQNISDVHISDNSSVRVLKLAMIYGANASGKSNLIRAFYSFISFILGKPDVGEQVRMYDPFLFDVNLNGSNAEFEIEFVSSNFVKHKYTVVFNRFKIVNEELISFPNGRPKNLFSRTDFEQEPNIHVGILGSDFGRREIRVFNNQLLLSKFGSDEPISELTDIFLYFRKYEVVNSANSTHKDKLRRDVSEAVINSDSLKSKMNSLIRFADIKLKEVRIENTKDPNSSERSRNPFIDSYSLFGIHSLYNGNSDTGKYHELSFKEESTGTQVLFSIGGRILMTLEKGGIIIIDELDISLHPFLTRMIILMFQSEKLNPHNAQLIFTTHDMTLLDRDLVRRDQVWISEKSENGASEIFSIQDFDGVREDTAFDKWYLAGKFGGLPELKSIDSMFDDTHAS